MARPRVVIDLGGIASLAYVERRDGGVAVGAMARQRDLELDTPRTRRTRCCARRSQLVAHPVIRNRGTVCGSIAHADSAAELPTLFATLDARARVVGPAASARWLVATFSIPHDHPLEPDELVREVGSRRRIRHGLRLRRERATTRRLRARGCLLRAEADGEARLGFSGVASRPAVRVDARSPRRRAAAADVVEAGDDYVASQASSASPGRAPDGRRACSSPPSGRERREPSSSPPRPRGSSR